MNSRYSSAQRIQFELPCPFCRAKLVDITRNGCTNKLQDHIIVEHLDQAYSSIMASAEDSALVKRRTVIHFVRNLRRWMPAADAAKRKSTGDSAPDAGMPKKA